MDFLKSIFGFGRFMACSRIDGSIRMTAVFPNGMTEERVVVRWRRVSDEDAEAVLEDGRVVEYHNATFRFEEMW